eukprot:PhM_4_TR2695/c0_g1_i1/m.63645
MYNTPILDVEHAWLRLECQVREVMSATLLATHLLPLEAPNTTPLFLPTDVIEDIIVMLAPTTWTFLNAVESLEPFQVEGTKCGILDDADEYARKWRSCFVARGSRNYITDITNESFEGHGMFAPSPGGGFVAMEWSADSSWLQDVNVVLSWHKSQDSHNVWNNLPSELRFSRINKQGIFIVGICPTHNKKCLLTPNDDGTYRKEVVPLGVGDGTAPDLESEQEEEEEEVNVTPKGCVKQHHLVVSLWCASSAAVEMVPLPENFVPPLHDDNMCWGSTKLEVETVKW